MRKRMFTSIMIEDLSSSGYSEPIYSYLSRSTRTSSERVRHLIESWLAHYPRKAQDELIPRLKSTDDDVLVSAFFELYIHELLRILGYEIEIHPSISDETQKKPDFLVIKKEEQFYLEAILSHERSAEVRKADLFLNYVLDKVNKIQSPDFYLHVEINGRAKSPISTRDLIAEIQQWLKSQNYDDLLPVYLIDGLLGMPCKRFELKGVTLSLKPIPKSRHRGGSEQLIGSHMHGFRKLNTKNAINRAIKRKTSRYGMLNLPYIVAINIQSMIFDSTDVLNALFGTEQILINDHCFQEDWPVYRRDGDGMWSKRKGTRLSGILTVKSITPWSVAYQNPNLYLNPWAIYPYKGDLLRLTSIEVQNDGKLISKDGIDAKELFNLSASWPENPDELI